MALTTYTELKAAIASRLHRSDLTTQIVDYITLAEERLNNEIKLAAQETEATLTASVGSRSLTLPSLFGLPIALYLTTYLPRCELEYRLPSLMQVYSSNGQSTYWTIDGATLNTDTPADIAYTYAFRYLAKYDLESTETNALLTNYPSLYLYGALIQAGEDIRDRALRDNSAQQFELALQVCKDREHGKRRLAPLVTELGSSRKQNIITGV